MFCGLRLKFVFYHIISHKNMYPGCSCNTIWHYSVNKSMLNQWISRLLMAGGSWLMTQGSRLMPQGSWIKAHGSWLMAKKNLARGPGAWDLPRQIFLGHEPLEPRALRHDPWALRHEPWIINERLTNDFFDYLSQALGINYPMNFSKPSAFCRGCLQGLVFSPKTLTPAYLGEISKYQNLGKQTNKHKKQKQARERSYENEQTQKKQASK